MDALGRRLAELVPVGTDPDLMHSAPPALRSRVFGEQRGQPADQTVKLG